MPHDALRARLQRKEYAAIAERATRDRRVLWAIGHIAERDAALVRFAAPRVAAFLDDANPTVRGLAAWCLGRLAERANLTRLRTLAQDPSAFPLFIEDELVEQTVSQVARDALIRLTEDEPQRKR